MKQSLSGKWKHLLLSLHLYLSLTTLSFASSEKTGQRARITRGLQYATDKTGNNDPHNSYIPTMPKAPPKQTDTNGSASKGVGAPGPDIVSTPVPSKNLLMKVKSTPDPLYGDSTTPPKPPPNPTDGNSYGSEYPDPPVGSPIKAPPKLPDNNVPGTATEPTQIPPKPPVQAKPEQPMASIPPPPVIPQIGRAHV